MHTSCRNGFVFNCVAVAMMLALSTGCKSPWSSDWKFADLFDMEKGMPWDDDGPKQGVPVRLVGTWTDTMLRQAGKQPQRGFGGRLLFYGNGGNQPILVDGQLVVYAFDESNRDPTDNRPTRRYVFPPDQLALRMSETELGPSYSFWLPWDEAGGPQTEISLISRFEPTGGALVVGEQTSHLLPGTLAPRTMLAKNTPPRLPDGTPTRPAIQQLSYSSDNRNGIRQPTQLAPYEQAAANMRGAATQMPRGAAMPHSPPRRMTTTSISLPENFRLPGGAASVRAGVMNDVRHAPAAVQPLVPAAPTPPNVMSVGNPTPTPTNARRATGMSQSAATQPQMIPRAMPYTPSPAVTSPAVTPLSRPARPTPLGVGFAPAGAHRMQAAYGGAGAQLPALPGNQTSSAARSLSKGRPLTPQTQMSAPSETTTSVSYLSPADSDRWGFRPQPSTGFGPSTPPAPATPAFR